jgi:hypothetical protein
MTTPQQWACTYQQDLIFRHGYQRVDGSTDHSIVGRRTRSGQEKPIHKGVTRDPGALPLWKPGVGVDPLPGVCERSR